MLLSCKTGDFCTTFAWRVNLRHCMHSGWYNHTVSRPNVSTYGKFLILFIIFVGLIGLEKKISHRHYR